MSALSNLEGNIRAKCREYETRRLSPLLKQLRGRRHTQNFSEAEQVGFSPVTRRLRLRDQLTQGPTANWNRDFLAPSPGLFPSYQAAPACGTKCGRKISRRPTGWGTCRGKEGNLPFLVVLLNPTLNFISCSAMSGSTSWYEDSHLTDEEMEAKQGTLTSCPISLPHRTQRAALRWQSISSGAKLGAVRSRGSPVCPQHPAGGSPEEYAVCSPCFLPDAGQALGKRCALHFSDEDTHYRQHL